VQGQQGNIGYFNNLEPDTRNITDGMTCTTKSTTVIGYEGCDLLAVFDKLHSDAFPDSGLGSLKHTQRLHFFQDDSFGVRSASKRVSLQSCTQMCLLVLLVVPFLLAAVVAELSSCTETTALACGPGPDMAA
uniref:Uncharacterized protein n=1 Tax=Leptobrachium leishanense TaxID=445787 RepID=A0A8C5LMY4_9ANUR